MLWFDGAFCCDNGGAQHEDPEPYHSDCLECIFSSRKDVSKTNSYLWLHYLDLHQNAPPIFAFLRGNAWRADHQGHRRLSELSEAVGAGQRQPRLPRQRRQRDILKELSARPRPADAICQADQPQNAAPRRSRITYEIGRQSASAADHIAKPSLFEVPNC